MMGGNRKFDQFALVAFVIVQSKQAKQKLGKKALQKKVHLIQELGAVDTGYQFAFYSYGPYSVSLAGDLDVIAKSGGAEISYDRSANCYEIDTSEHTGRMQERGREFVEKNKAAIERVLESFGERSAKDLELVSTIAYLHRHAPREEFDDNGELAKHVMDLKPRYEKTDVEKAVYEVKAFLSYENGTEAALTSVGGQ